MTYSDLTDEEVKLIIDEIDDTKLYVDLILLEQEMVRKGIVNNKAFRYLQKEIEERSIAENEIKTRRK